MKSKIIIAAWLSLSFVTSHSQDTVKLDYSQYIETVIGHHPISKRAGNIKKYGDLQLKAARGNYDPQVNGNYEQKFFKGLNYYTNLSGEIKQPIFTSQYIKFGYDYGAGHFLNPEHLTPPNGLPYLGLEVGLLQGFTLDKRRTEVLKAREYIGYYESESRIVMNDLLLNASEKYFEWIYNIRQLSLNRYFLDLAIERVNAISNQVIIGEKASVDTIEANILLQSRQLEYQDAFLAVQKSHNELATYLWNGSQPYSSAPAFAALQELDDYYNNALVRFKLILADTVQKNPVISKMRVVQSILDIERRWKREQIKPVLNLSYNFLSRNDLNPSLSPANYKWGLTLAFPILLRQQRNQFGMAKIDAENNRFETRAKANELRFKTDMVAKTYELLMQQLANTGKTVSYARQLLEAEKEKFSIGESSLFLLNTRENKWLEAELKFAQLKLKLILLFNQLIYLKGTLDYGLI